MIAICSAMGKLSLPGGFLFHVKSSGVFNHRAHLAA